MRICSWPLFPLDLKKLIRYCLTGRAYPCERNPRVACLLEELFILRLLRFLFLCCSAARMMPLHCSCFGAEEEEPLLLRRRALSLWTSCSLLVENGPRRSGAPVDATTHWCVETTTAASPRIVGDFSFLDAWLGGGDAEAYFGLPSLWKSWELNVGFPNALTLVLLPSRRRLLE